MIPASCDLSGRGHRPLAARMPVIASAHAEDWGGTAMLPAFSSNTFPFAGPILLPGSAPHRCAAAGIDGAQGCDPRGLGNQPAGDLGQKDLAGEGSMSLYDIIRAGRVARWHANPDMAHIRETNAEHQWMVAVILLQLLPKDAAPLAEHLTFAALHHDVGEVIGDLPAPFKDRRPEVAALHAEEEAKVREEMGAGFWLTAEERDWLSLADRLAAWVHVAHHRPELLGDSGWPEATRWIVFEAARLGCLGAIRPMMRKMMVVVNMCPPEVAA